MIDTHSHIYLKDFRHDLKNVVKNAQNKQVKKVLLPNIDVESVADVWNTYQQYKDYTRVMMGLHPCSVKEDYKKQLDIIRPHLTKEGCVAVGEIGTDLHWDATYWKEQQDAFLIQCQWASETNLPIAIHCRKSLDETIKLLQGIKQKEIRGVFHCFTGSETQIQEINDLGFYFGIGGVVTFKNSGLDKFISKLPPEKIILETDSPYLSPTPLRGERNEPANLSYIISKISEILDKSIEEIDHLTTQNSHRLFDLS